MKKAALFLFLLITALLLFSCGQGETQNLQGSQADTSESSAGTERSDTETEKKEGNKSEIKEDPKMIVSLIGKLRDPFVLAENGKYYVYGTGWKCAVSSRGKLDGLWSVYGGGIVTVPADAVKDMWAPEVYKYNGEYYMFTTYYSAKNGHRGCSVFKSARPTGPFVEISDGHVTPSDWDAIDGTLYIDPDGTPWMVFVHEWTSMKDGVGSMAAAKMSADLTHFVSEPIELFRATDAKWARSGVTDGCFMRLCENGELIMLWSTFDQYGYCVGVARSDNGRLDGNWTHDDSPLYTKGTDGQYDGGHCMLFTSLEGQLYLCMHSPNNSSLGRSETPVFIPVKEENGRIILLDK